MRAKEISPRKKPIEPVTETNGSLSAVPGRSSPPQMNKKSRAKQDVESVVSGNILKRQ
jgi:hypothetical protein